MNAFYLVEAGSWWEQYDIVGVFDDLDLALAAAKEWSAPDSASTPRRVKRWGHVTHVPLNQPAHNRSNIKYTFTDGEADASNPSN